jgi:pyrroline-5-carboxylate reductase
VLGTAWLAATTGESMDDIARRVASPKGTTEAGLAVLDSEHVLDQLVAVTIEAAAKRGAELAEEARAGQLAESPRLS